MQSFLDPAAISQAEGLGLQARLIVEGYMAGEHRSPFHGFAIEFSQHREYGPGDDIRHLDWKVLGRTDRYYIKQYDQETNYVAHLVLDGSESMKYGSGKLSKFDFARVLGACLAYLVLNQRDAVSLEVFDTKVRTHLPRSGNLGSIRTIMEALSGFEPAGETDIGGVLHELAGRIKRRGIVVVISDCLANDEGVLAGIQHLRFTGSEVILFHVMDPFELEFPFKGMIEFEGLENAPKQKAQAAEIRKSYLAEVEQFCRSLREGCEKMNCHYQLVNTGHPVAEVLSGYLAFRAGQTRR
jgi:uncharacterized protein (DUF58 family)